MKNKITVLQIFLIVGLFSTSAHAAEPDESGVGGTGRTAAPEMPFELFDRPDLPERIDLPDIITAPELPEVDAGAVSDMAPPTNAGSLPDVPTGAGAAGSSP